ncbi:MAG: hypothetical protein AAFZ92_06705, partial [Pseudomonadota bacterium]
MYNPLSKKERRLKQARKRVALLSDYKAIQLCINYQNSILESDVRGIGNQEKDEIIVSLTTIESRLDKVAYTIESLMQQTLKADQIFLCLGEDQIQKQDIPLDLKKLESRGLTIKFCKKDLGPYTKFFYTLKNNPDSLIITVDDDILYPANTLEKLYSAYRKESNVIHCHRGHKIKISGNHILPYKQWQYSSQEPAASKLIFPTGVGGVLYFPGALDEQVLNQEVFMDICPKADDIWLKAMSLKKGVLCRTIQHLDSFQYEFPSIPGSQLVSLKRANKKNDGNNLKLINTFKKYNLNEK